MSPADSEQQDQHHDRLSFPLAPLRRLRRSKPRAECAPLDEPHSRRAEPAPCRSGQWAGASTGAGAGRGGRPERRSALEAQNAALRLTHGELTAEITVRDEEISRLQLDLEALHATLTDARLAVGDERIRSQRLMMQVEDARSSLLSLLEICHSADALETLRAVGFTELGEATRACIADYAGMHAERRQLTASLEVALSQRDAFQQGLAGQDPAYDVLEARLADVLTQLSDCSVARDNLGAELARLQRVVRENNAFIDAQRSQLGDQEGYIARLITGGADAADLDRLCAAR